MRKTTFFTIAVIFTLAIALASCGGISYAEHLDQEKKGIKNFLSAHGYVVLKTYPNKGIFAPNEFYKDENGVYIHVSDTGTEAKPVKANMPYLSGDKVYLRMGPIVSLVDIKKIDNDTLSLGNNNQHNLTQTLNFDYGNESTYTISPQNSNNTLGQLMLSPSCVEPLDLGLHYGAVVSMIVPFEQGSSLQQSEYFPIYISNMTYVPEGRIGIVPKK